MVPQTGLKLTNTPPEEQDDQSWRLFEYMISEFWIQQISFITVTGEILHW